MKKVNKDLESNKKTDSTNETNSRRNFLKKATYSAPVLLALGQLAKPTKAQADSGAPDGPPDWGGF